MPFLPTSIFNNNYLIIYSVSIISFLKFIVKLFSAFICKNKSLAVTSQAFVGNIFKQGRGFLIPVEKRKKKGGKRRSLKIQTVRRH